MSTTSIKTCPKTAAENIENKIRIDKLSVIRAGYKALDVVTNGAYTKSWHDTFGDWTEEEQYEWELYRSTQFTSLPPPAGKKCCW